ncbi:hypothetical protein GCM10007216_06600 [Thalassobacillus devorans]|uniref:Uncharacterized protein n=1 Tax=Thalassobacillus devorans TaxID=279813 RepID=A0ABQ1NJK7_9BACI|nr:hypothetical protein [Thalassobacillus devorans]NIK27571.1 hypothetical protein [Thalassobacillus devorans]GGC78789.1 hypothetical protein GCM10007216_06600 [Thalassobacillus devorans]
MQIKVMWINFHKASELDRPELFQRMDEIKLENDRKEKKTIEEAAKDKLSEQFNIPAKEIQIIEYKATDEITN